MPTQQRKEKTIEYPYRKDKVEIVRWCIDITCQKLKRFLWNPTSERVHVCKRCHC